MIIKLIRNITELKSLKHEWNELLDDSEADTVFLTWQWIASWIEIQEIKPDIFVVVAKDYDGRLISIAPFYRTKYRLLGCKKLSVLRVLGDTSSGAEYGNIIVRRGHVDEAADLLAKTMAAFDKEWDIIWMPNFAKWKKADEIIYRMGNHAGLMMRERDCSFSAAALPDDPDNYLQTMSANRRQQVRRICRKIFADSRMKIVEVCDPDSLAFYLDALFDLHEKRWSTKSDPGAFERIPNLKSFYRSFAPKAMQNGWLSIVALEDADSVVAIQYGYRYKGTYMQLQEGFDPNYKRGLGKL